MMNLSDLQRWLFILAAVLMPWFGRAQSIQPLGIPNGTYKIEPSGTSELQTYCLDKSIYTDQGTSYDRVALGGEQILRIGGQNYTVSDALAQHLISFTFSHSDRGKMYISIQNHTNKDINWVVEKDLVLSDKKSTNVLKSTVALNHVPENLSVPKQQYIWFSQAYDDYFNKYENVLKEVGLVRENESLKLDEYLKRRDDFLNTNGVQDKTLVDKSEHEVIYDYAVLNLIASKVTLREVAENTSRSTFYIRCFKQNGLLYYCLDDGSLSPLLTRSSGEILSVITKENKAFVCIDKNVPVDKKNALLGSLRLSHSTVAEDLRLEDLERFQSLTDKAPEIKAVEDVTESILYDGYYFEIDYKVNELEEKATITSPSKSVLGKIHSIFKRLVGITSSRSIVDTYEEAKLVAKQAFPSQKIRTKLSSNFASMTISNNISKAVRNRMALYVYNKTSY